MSGAILIPALATLLGLLVTAGATVIVARYGKAEKAEERESAEELALQGLLDARLKDLLDRLGRRVDELEGETRELRAELKDERAARHTLEVEVSTLRQENAGLRAQMARLTGLAAGAEADTAGGSDD